MKGYSKKPANQGSAGKANVQKARVDGTPKKGNPKGGTLFLSKQPKGTRGSKNK